MGQFSIAVDNVAQKAAAQWKAELNYRPDLNWRTYACLLEFAGYLKDASERMGMEPRDMIDLHFFMRCIALGKYE